MSDAAETLFDIAMAVGAEEYGYAKWIEVRKRIRDLLNEFYSSVDDPAIKPPGYMRKAKT